ncbi:EAL domain-containing protein [Gordonibacter massiliensis (ex Traore et al. 2017)]|uniref:EAL domain-containing protein n=1 Tax=Gordonibacter massiliensis (ex Traore et al. 2017) TaxID=1841863 RepID=UPI001C8B2FBE|nr:EAL domain-containing protein [Gordonibacter massiliensis (ex Traore et al. 2017)]MBX9033861.1 EAL domain-containing protein [Gordonibacter massiliensis (ex Traore et al. 2017)]
MDAPSLKALEHENAELRERLNDARRYDGLTGLLSKGAFCDVVSTALDRSSSERHVIVCFDIRRFKLVNDLHGLEEGDELLRSFAGALKHRFADVAGSFVGRLGGDLFVVFAPAMTIGEVQRALDDVCSACPERFDPTAVAGIYRIEDRGLPVALMCDRAMMALRTVKESYFGRVAEYEPGLRDALVEERALLDGIEVALDEDQIEPFFQPKCNIRTGKIVGAEALARWRHPERGIVPPAEFVPLLERNGFIRALDVRVWERTAAWIAQLVAQGIEPVPVSVNVSRADVDGMDVCATLTGIVERYGIDRSLMEVEITESAYADRRDSIIEASDELMAEGFVVLMDDFGSGYSSLNMLRDINVNVLKIDMRFLDRTDRRSRDIMESVVHMARWLDLPVIAEGVETDEQVRFLLDVGCVFAQGFRFYRPMDAASFAALLAEGDNVERVTLSERFDTEGSSVFDFKDLLHEDVISDRMLTNILGAVALFSLDGASLRVLRGNPAYRDLVEWDGEGGTARADVLDRVHEDDRPLLLDAARRARTAHDDEGVEVTVRRTAGSRTKWLELRLFHLYASGDADVLYGGVSDVTERMEDVEALRMSERRFEIAMEASGLVVFELDIPTRTARYSAYVQNAFGLDATVANAPEGFIEQGSVDEVSVGDFRALYERIFRGDSRSSTVVRAHMADGSTVWNRITLIAVENERGKATKAVGLVENITREKEMELSLSQRGLVLSEANQRVLARLLEGTVTFGAIGRYLERDFPLYFLTAEMLALLGYGTYSELIEATGGIAHVLARVDDLEELERGMLELKVGEGYRIRYSFVCKDGSLLPVEERGFAVEAEDGRPAIIGLCMVL